ncbi:acid phosphatase 1-like [Capsicum annuum]|uniref:acid phosphatase 1-like n=1 Tax=Capsicum annuum TaxID=4072 RepID=UPI0007BEAF5E|nr:acid phosphatase 1-like [Capsicum annuum]
MKVMILLLLLLIAIGAEATSSDVAAAPNQVNYLCWHLLVETNNIRDWDTVPPQCKCYVSKYMTGQQYRDYCNAVVDAAIKYAKTLNVSKDGKDLWVFNVDETTLSNVPYYFRPTFRAAGDNFAALDEATMHEELLAGWGYFLVVLHRRGERDGGGAAVRLVLR